MAKTNYTNMEKNLEDNLVKLQKEKLLDMADKAQDPTKKPKDKKKKEDKEEPKAKTKKADIKKRLIHSLKRDIQRLKKKDESFFEKMGFSQEEVSKLIENPSSLSPEEWEKIKNIKEKLDELKKELLGSFEKDYNEELVDKERKDHVNKRHNVKKNWLPS